MTALILAIVGLAPGVLVATAYWIGQGACSAKRRRVTKRQALEDADREFDANMRRRAIQLPIQALLIRAAKVATRLRFSGESQAATLVDRSIAACDRDALVAILCEENG